MLFSEENSSHAWPRRVVTARGTVTTRPSAPSASHFNDICSLLQFHQDCAVHHNMSRVLTEMSVECCVEWYGVYPVLQPFSCHSAVWSFPTKQSVCRLCVGTKPHSHTNSSLFWLMRNQIDWQLNI